jgi:hypothetical protein
MSKSKIVAMMALIAFTMCIFLVGSAVAGREATESVTGGFYSTVKIIAFGEDYMYGSNEGFGVWIGETGKEMLHNVAVRNVVGWQMEKGSYSERGAAVFTLPNGDKIYVRFSASGKAGEIPKGTLTILGGTGKCAGIEGSAEWTEIVSTFSEGVWQGLVPMKIHYKLP